MATVQEIKEAAKEISESVTRYGCFNLTPPVALRCREAINEKKDEFGKKGDVVHADKVDEKGKYSNTVHLVEKGLWWSVELFDICES